MTLQEAVCLDRLDHRLKDSIWLHPEQRFGVIPMDADDLRMLSALIHAQEALLKEALDNRLG
jgi:hypothetical protein